MDSILKFNRFCLFHTTSAAAERANSIINKTSDQQSLMGDAVLEARAIIQYNSKFKFDE